jgi:serine/threonine kinase 16
MKEVEAYALFAPHPNIIHSVDYSVQADRSDPGAKIVYILLPYYRRGNLQDIINANLINHTKFSERRLMPLFLGACNALKAMHQYRVRGPPSGTDVAGRAQADEESANEVASGKRKNKNTDRDVEDIEQEPLMEGEVARSQEGVGPGELRAYAHRDIKPGE